jgi:pilus assembly protein FimV
MKRTFYIVILLTLFPVLANALGLGNLDLNSALNEPFDARIELLSPTADELDSLKVNLADSQAFARANIDRPFLLSKLRFALRRSVDDGPDYIRVFSQEPIREPFLNFLVEVSWSNGRLFREYTVLLDPPLYDPNVRASEFAQVAEVETSTSMETVTIDDPDHKVVYGDAYEKFAKSNTTSSPGPTYTPNINYTGGDYGPTTGSDTLWSIASAMRPDSSVSVNQMMMALLRTNPDAFAGQNINGLKRGQILRMPNESEMIALNNAEALAEVQSQYSAWGDIKDNLSSDVSERPEVSSVPETTIPDSSAAVTEEVSTDPELKLVAANDTTEASQQVSSTDSGTGEDLILAQESIQALTQENLELKDQVQESEALLEDLKRLLSLKDDELAALQEQMAMQGAAEEEMMEEAEEVVEEAEEEMMEEAEEVVEEAEEEMMEEAEEVVDEAEEEMMEEAEEVVDEAEEEMMEEVVDEAEEEIMEVVETDPGSAGIMGKVNQYIAPVKEMLLGNKMIGMAVGGVLAILLIIIGLLKFRKEPAETIDLNAPTEEAFPDFDSGDIGETGAEVPESEAVTVLPDSEAETAMPEESAEFDLDIEGEEEAKTEFIAAEETPVEEAPAEEEEPEEDPLQEVNTYLAFEQFDQAEEFVRNVINDDPDNPEYHAKLLEVFYTSGNKKAYEEAAKVLHDKVGGEGEYWNMATAMWQEMSPNRALFEEGAVDEDDSAMDTTGGFVDVTADEEAGSDSGDLDFDIGGAEETPAPAETVAEDASEMLDITGADVGEDLLDVTAAVGLGEGVDTEAETAQPSTTDDVLDISGASTGTDDLLDLTSGEETTGEDLLDVTAAANLDLDSEEDLLDVTAATSAGADSSELLDIENETDTDSNEIEFDVPAETNETVEFDLGDSNEPEASIEESDDNVIDFDMTSNESNDIEIETSEPEADDAGLEIDLGLEESSEEPIQLDVEEDEGLSLDMESAEDEGEISLDLDMGDTADEGIELDLSDTSDETPEIELDMDVAEEEPAPADTAADEMDFDLSFEETPVETSGDEIDLDGTVEIPKSSVEVDDDDDDDEDHTVFVPRAAQPEEQSSEDEIATKLDLAKAYVELGDSDSAKTILDEVMAEGNDEQRKQAEDLLGQV